MIACPGAEPPREDQESDPLAAVMISRHNHVSRTRLMNQHSGDIDHQRDSTRERQTLAQSLIGN
jgi:hypothetical protein